MKKRIFASILALILCLSVMGAAVLASEESAAPEASAGALPTVEEKPAEEEAPQTTEEAAEEEAPAPEAPRLRTSQSPPWTA